MVKQKKPTIYLRNFESERRLRDASALEPQHLFIDVSGHGRMARSGVMVKAQASVMRLIAMLFAAQERPVPIEEMAEIMYGLRRDGGPDNLEQVIYRLISAARIAGAALGFRIESRHGMGLVARLVTPSGTAPKAA